MISEAGTYMACIARKLMASTFETLKQQPNVRTNYLSTYDFMCSLFIYMYYSFFIALFIQDFLKRSLFVCMYQILFIALFVRDLPIILFYSFINEGLICGLIGIHSHDLFFL